jgi:4-carboxymuconolactone decarboxylase
MTLFSNASYRMKGLVLFMTAMLSATNSPAQEGYTEQGKRGLQVLQSGADGKGKPPHFAQLEKDFPYLANITLEYALGEIWARDVLDPVTRQLTGLAAFAAQGTLNQFRVHAGYALQLGAKPEQLMEVIYLVTVTSGSPRALDAAGVLKEVFTEKGITLPLKSETK